MKSIVSLFAALLVSSAALAASVEDDVNRYIAIFNGDINLHNQAVESLAWMGLSDPRLYDVLEQRILSEARSARSNSDAKNRVARYMRALGFSGNEKYIPTLTKYGSDMVYQRYVGVALEEMQQHRVWNPIISNRATFDPKYSDDVNRVANMLRSNDLLLMKIGAKRVFFENKDEVLLDLLAKNLQANYLSPSSAHVDAVAWLVKALGSAKNPKYRPLIQEVASKSRDSKVAMYAKQALEGKN